MPAIDIGADQADYLEELREALAETYLEGYGEMRTRDALQYLIDQHEAVRGDGPLVEGTDSASPSDGATDTAEPALERTDAVATGDAAENEGTNAVDGETVDADTTDGEPSPGGSPLQQMMRLLDEHDDVWEEVDSNDGKYAVELPDGSTEHARTKDDVRALLFKHYR